MSDVETDHDAINRIVGELARDFPGVGLSFGYIGNVSSSPRRDDRLWMVFTRLSTCVNPRGCNVSFGGASTEEIPQLRRVVEDGLGTWVTLQQSRIDRGEVYRVGA